MIKQINYNHSHSHNSYHSIHTSKKHLQRNLIRSIKFKLQWRANTINYKDNSSRSCSNNKLILIKTHNRFTSSNNNSNNILNIPSLNKLLLLGVTSSTIRTTIKLLVTKTLITHCHIPIATTTTMAVVIHLITNRIKTTTTGTIVTAVAILMARFTTVLQFQ